MWSLLVITLVPNISVSSSCSPVLRFPTVVLWLSLSCVIDSRQKALPNLSNSQVWKIYFFAFASLLTKKKIAKRLLSLGSTRGRRGTFSESVHNNRNFYQSLSKRADWGLNGMYMTTYDRGKKGRKYLFAPVPVMGQCLIRSARFTAEHALLKYLNSQQSWP